MKKLFKNQVMFAFQSKAFYNCPDENHAGAFLITKCALHLIDKHLFFYILGIHRRWGNPPIKLSVYATVQNTLFTYTNITLSSCFAYS